jgi:hypothetical protein
VVDVVDAMDAMDAVDAPHTWCVCVHVCVCAPHTSVYTTQTVANVKKIVQKIVTKMANTHTRTLFTF